MEDKVFCSDILDALTQDFFARKGNPIEEPAHVEEIKVEMKIQKSSSQKIVGVLPNLMTPSYPGDNVCGSSRLRANVFVFVETTRRILRLSDTEGLEGQSKHSSFHMLPNNLINLC